jgi:subtilase family serine protease
VTLTVLGIVAAGAQSLSTQVLQGATNSTPAPPVTPVVNGTAKLVSHYDPSKKLRLVIALQPPDMAGEEQLLKELHNKKSPQFHKFLTADEWNRRFAPSAQDEHAIVDWAQAQGLTVTHRYPNRLLGDLEAPSGAIEKALSITINTYQVGAVTFFSNDREPTIPANLYGIVHSIGGLDNLRVLHPASKGSIEPKFQDYVPGPVVGTGMAGGHSGNGKKPANR